jgi:hypothetical protein
METPPSSTSSRTSSVQYDEQTPLLIQNVDHSSLERGSSATTTIARDREAHAEAITPLPWGPVLVLFVLYTVTPLTYELIFPFISESIYFCNLVPIPNLVGPLSAIRIFRVARPSFKDLMLCLR